MPSNITFAIGILVQAAEVNTLIVCLFTRSLHVFQFSGFKIIAHGGK